MRVAGATASWRRPSSSPRPRPSGPSETARSTSRSISPSRAISRSRSSATFVAGSCTSASGVLAPAAPPENPGGGPVPGSHPRAPPPDGGGGCRGGPGRRLRRRRDDRIPARRGRLVLLHGDEHADPGRASGHRDGDGVRPREGADPGRGRRAASFGELHEGSGFASRGHAIEFRINAEDPVTFAPSPGTVTTLHLPGGPGVRVDTAAYAGWKIPPYYDSLIAKLVVHGRDREEAIMRGRRALELFIVEGVKTTIPLHRRLLDEPDFRAGRFSTKWLERWLARRPEDET